MSEVGIIRPFDTVLITWLIHIIDYEFTIFAKIAQCITVNHGLFMGPQIILICEFVVMCWVFSEHLDK